MRKFMMAGGLVLASAVGAQAADLMIDEAPAPMDTSLVNSSIYVQLLGGVALSGDVDFYVDYGDLYDWTLDASAGYALAATIGVVVVDGFSVEADFLYTNRSDGETAPYEDIYTTASLMGNVKYTLPVNDMFSIYGAAGLGVIGGTHVYTDGDDDVHYSGLGYQLIAGVSAELTDNISAVAEYRYQNTFDVASNVDDDYFAVQAPTSTVLVGLKFGF